jgi:hypothetical protein
MKKNISHITPCRRVLEKLRVIQLTKKFDRKRPVGRHRHRYEDNIRMDLTETDREVVDWIHLDQNRDQWRGLVSTVILTSDCCLRAKRIAFCYVRSL